MTPYKDSHDHCSASSRSFFSLFIVVLAVEAIGVLSSQAPPVKVFLHPLHLQIPTETFLMAGYEH